MVTIKTSSVGKTSTQNKRRGFTLIELIVILVILGLSAAVVYPRIGAGLQGAKIRAGLRDASDLLRYARAQSIMTREQWRVQVDGKGGVLDLLGTTQDDESDILTKSVVLPEGLSILSVRTELSTNRASRKEDTGPKDIIFYPVGNSSGGRIEFRDAKNRMYTIEVNPFNGKVRIIDETAS
jgi:type II secretion system protein H